MFKLYEYSPSGNCYKVRLLLTQLNIPFDRTEINILQKESRTPEFLVKNPNGRIPVLEIVPGKFLFESNAIMFYLSEETEFFPSDKFERAQVMQWLFFEQYSHEPFIATSRFWYLTGKAEEYQAALQQKQAPGYAALGVMEQHLEKNKFFVGDRYSIADIGLFAYTHVAAEGGFDLTGFPAIKTWIERIKNQPRYISITD
ncbi:MAG: glutathione S-transferase family protein [Oscillatoriales cyanobacterium]|uniref:glutathione S-transferase family protein n=1 Tax=Microcoleus sp. PH2017_05_CCC_O_A TaxID=2798816 RepID=UPI001D40AE6A|nr:glutathione S-transferase family protein [Microcoleus sp. PH2017_05_CCC_O_A]TAF99800.1 MAG: glutathione S-transferase family protein [Oscillatoriales cyanobacterium]MCC3436898.1 glutathione S-transferase family protein [Microcoleus sp. PH2017_05_CCC_O_A]TAG15296.1 MAG: glutathione S-transferase family protein [Oscillatoriales cyanobacterium]TAG41762.1 MAG: glutathione S-transferase family protein [Oscillatoriales cyanobacterium]TAG55409.1 MAG: glutathione S-transferase family protein [Oscil